MAKLIGTGTNQVPTNGMLGGMAFQTPEDVTVKKIQEEGYNVVTQTDIGTAPNQIPLNQFLGGLAYMDSVAGLDFSATSSSSTGTVTSQILDDYEEGTFSPSIHGWTGTYSIQYGMYTKIGRLVIIQCEVKTTGGTGSFSQAYPGVANLPFARDNSTPSYRAMGVWGIVGTASYGTSQVGGGLFDAHNATTALFPNNFNVAGGLGNFNGFSAASDAGYRALIVYKTVS